MNKTQPSSAFFSLIISLLIALSGCSETKKAEQTTQGSDSASSGVSYEQVATESAAIADQLKNAAAEINRQCPVQVDAGTRLDSARAMSQTELQYFYTLTALSRDQVDVAKLEATTKPALIESVRTNAAMAELRDHSITMTYLYRDRNGEQVMRLSVGPAEYGQ